MTYALRVVRPSCIAYCQHDTSTRLPFVFLDVVPPDNRVFSFWPVTGIDKALDRLSLGLLKTDFRTGK